MPSTDKLSGQNLNLLFHTPGLQGAPQQISPHINLDHVMTCSAYCNIAHPAERRVHSTHAAQGFSSLLWHHTQVLAASSPPRPTSAGRPGGQPVAAGWRPPARAPSPAPAASSAPAAPAAAGRPAPPWTLPAPPPAQHVPPPRSALPKGLHSLPHVMPPGWAHFTDYPPRV